MLSHMSRVECVIVHPLEGRGLVTREVVRLPVPGIAIADANTMTSAVLREGADGRGFMVAIVAKNEAAAAAIRRAIEAGRNFYVRILSVAVLASAWQMGLDVEISTRRRALLATLVASRYVGRGRRAVFWPYS